MTFKKLIILALILRVVLLPLSFHSDLNNNAIWGRYAFEFGFRGFYDWLNFGNYARPDYPPLAMILFWAIYHVWNVLFNILWKLNISFSFFPSNIIPWFEDYGVHLLIKLPGILADLGIGYAIYKWVQEEVNDKTAKYASAVFLFNPAIIYLSASWGQLDSIVSFLGLMAILLTLKKKYFPAVSLFFGSIMIKATMVLLAPLLVMQTVKQKIKPINLVILASWVTALCLAIGYIFIDKNYLLWTVEMYIKKILPGAVTLPYINLNAFNFWGLVVGLERMPDTSLFMGQEVFKWAWLITLIFFVAIWITFFKKGNIFWAAMLMYFSAFLFMPRVHERYLYPIFVFLPFIMAKLAKVKKYYFILSGVFLINLYHWWWFPEVGFLVSFFDLELIERGLALVNLVIFGFLFRDYLQLKKL